MPDDTIKIPDASGLLRRVHPEQIVQDKNLGHRRLSSGAFRAKQMSVDVEPMLTAAGLDWTFTLRGYEQFFLVRFKAQFVRAYGQSVEHKPIRGNPCHAEVIGPKPKSVRDAFRDAAEWIKKPADIP